MSGAVLTEEQVQQIEEALLPYAYQYVEISAAYTVTKSDVFVEIALAAIRAARAQEQAEQDLDTCPGCGGVADNGHDREFPPNPYYCTKCSEQVEQEPVGEVVLERMGAGDAQIVRFQMYGKIPPVGTKLYAAPQPVSQEYQDHLANQSFDWAAMAAKHQFMEGYRIGLAEMREKCAKVCDTRKPIITTEKRGQMNVPQPSEQETHD